MPVMRGTTLALMLYQLVAFVQAEEIEKRKTSRHENHLLLLVHGSTACLAWVVFFPLGSVLIRLMKTKNSIWIHAGIQVLATALYTIAIGTGIYLSNTYHIIDQYHPILGLVIFALVFVQIAGGILHHLFFRKYLRRTVISHIHIWMGRILITVGIINGGLGLLLAEGTPVSPPNSAIIAYGVIGGIIWAITMAIGFWKSPWKNANVKVAEKKEILGESELSSPISERVPSNERF